MSKKIKDILARAKEFEKEFGRRKSFESAKTETGFKPFKDFSKSENKSPLARFGGKPLVELTPMAEVLSPITGSSPTTQPSAPAKKPEYKLPGPDGIIGTDDDVINPDYKMGFGKNILAGFSLGGQLGGQASQNVYYQLGAVLGGGVAALINPELGGKAAYEKDLAQFYARTKADLEQEQMRANIAKTEVLNDYNVNKSAFQKARTSALTADTDREQFFESTAFFMNSYKNTSLAEIRDSAALELRTNLIKWYGIQGKKPEEAQRQVRIMSDVEVYNELANNIFDPKARTQVINFVHHRPNLAGDMIPVTDARGTAMVEKAEIISFMKDQITKGRAEADKKPVAPEARDKAWKDAEDKLRDRGGLRYKDGEYTSTARTLLMAEFNYQLGLINNDGKPFDIMMPLPNGEFVKVSSKDWEAEFNKAWTAPAQNLPKSSGVAASPTPGSQNLTAGTVSPTPGPGAVQPIELDETVGQIDAKIKPQYDALETALNAPKLNSGNIAGALEALEKQAETNKIEPVYPPALTRVRTNYVNNLINKGLGKFDINYNYKATNYKVIAELDPNDIDFEKDGSITHIFRYKLDGTMDLTAGTLADLRTHLKAVFTGINIDDSVVDASKIKDNAYTPFPVGRNETTGTGYYFFIGREGGRFVGYPVIVRKVSPRGAPKVMSDDPFTFKLGDFIKYQRPPAPTEK